MVMLNYLCIYTPYFLVVTFYMRKMWRKRHVLCLCFVAYYCIGVKVSGESQGQTPALSPDEQYQDLFPLTSANFTDNVLRNKDPWIVIFHDGFIEREWKTMATHLRGLCWCGMVDTTRESKLLETLKYDASEGAARMYPYGDRKKKRENWRSVKTANEARTLALQSLPDKTQRLSSQSLPDFLLDGFTSNPARFPAYIITDSKETPVVMKAIAKQFERYFLFGKVVNPASDELDNLGLGKVYLNPPELFVMVTQGGKPESLDAVKFDKDRHGVMNYTSILQFLFQINTNFRHGLPGNNMASTKEVAEMADILKVEAKRFQIIYDHDTDERSTRNSKENKEDTGATTKFQTRVGTLDEL